MNKLKPILAMVGLITCNSASCLAQFRGEVAANRIYLLSDEPVELTEIEVIAANGSFRTTAEFSPIVVDTDSDQRIELILREPFRFEGVWDTQVIYTGDDPASGLDGFYSTVNAAEIPFAFTQVSEPPSVLEATQRKIARNLAVWQSFGFEDYDFEFAESCFCGFLPTGKAIIVRQGQVQSVTDVVTGEVLDDPHWFLTIDDIFARTAAFDFEGIGAKFDDTFGFPTRLHLDRFVGGDDDETTLTISNFRAVPEPQFCIAAWMVFVGWLALARRTSLRSWVGAKVLHLR